MLIVDNLMPNINRRAVTFERTFNNFDGTDNPRAKSARLRKNNFQTVAPFALLCYLAQPVWIMPLLAYIVTFQS